MRGCASSTFRSSTGIIPAAQLPHDPLALACRFCGYSNEPGVRFCGGAVSRWRLPRRRRVKLGAPEMYIPKYLAEAEGVDIDYPQTGIAESSVLRVRVLRLAMDHRLAASRAATAKSPGNAS